MIITVFAGIAEFERDLIIERTSTGRIAAKERGVKFGRPRICMLILNFYYPSKILFLDYIFYQLRTAKQYSYRFKKNSTTSMQKQIKVGKKQKILNKAQAVKGFDFSTLFSIGVCQFSYLFNL